MTLSRSFFVFYIFLQILQCLNCGKLENQKGIKQSSSRNLHIFAEKFKPFLYETDDNHTYIGINYFLIKTIAERLNMGISLDLASNVNRLKNWKPSTK